MLASNSSSQILNHNPFSCRYDCWVQEPIWLKRWTIQSMDHWNREPKTDFYIVITYSHLSWASWPVQRSLCCAQGIYTKYHYTIYPYLLETTEKNFLLATSGWSPSSRNYGHRIKVLRSKDLVQLCSPLYAYGFAFEHSLMTTSPLTTWRGGL